jgi:hypothetical protein
MSPFLPNLLCPCEKPSRNRNHEAQPLGRRGRPSGFGRDMRIIRYPSQPNFDFGHSAGAPQASIWVSRERMHGVNWAENVQDECTRLPPDTALEGVHTGGLSNHLTLPVAGLVRMQGWSKRPPGVRTRSRALMWPAEDSGAAFPSLRSTPRQYRWCRRAAMRARWEYDSRVSSTTAVRALQLSEQHDYSATAVRAGLQASSIIQRNGSNRCKPLGAKGASNSLVECCVYAQLGLVNLLIVLILYEIDLFLLS